MKDIESLLHGAIDMHVHAYISTDHFFDWTPSIPQQIYQVLGCLLEAGISYEELQTVMDTPKLLFGVK